MVRVAVPQTSFTWPTPLALTLLRSYKARVCPWLTRRLLWLSKSRLLLVAILSVSLWRTFKVAHKVVVLRTTRLLVLPSLLDLIYFTRGASRLRVFFCPHQNDWYDPNLNERQSWTIHPEFPIVWLSRGICPDRSLCCLRCGPARAEQNGSANVRQQEDQPYGISFCPDT